MRNTKALPLRQSTAGGVQHPIDQSDTKAQVHKRLLSPAASGGRCRHRVRKHSDEFGSRKRLCYLARVLQKEKVVRLLLLQRRTPATHRLCPTESWWNRFHVRPSRARALL